MKIYQQARPNCLQYFFHTKNKGYIKSFIFYDKLDGQTKVIVISDFFQNAILCSDLKNGFQRFSNGQIFKN
jgi:hypothetical protein